MGYSDKQRNKEIERLSRQGLSKKQIERIVIKQGFRKKVKESFQIAKEQVTLPISNQIQADIDEIGNAINNLDKKDKDFPEKKERLQKLLHTVASNYAIKKETVAIVQEQINKILGVNRSDNA